MREHISDSDASRALAAAVAADGLLDADDSAVLLYDLDMLDERIAELNRLFPADALHTTAIKANPLLGVLELARRRGCGAEAASLPELTLAGRAGFAPQGTVFDSPAKTRTEIDRALAAGVFVNVDSLAELDRVAEAVAHGAPPPAVGVRVNPQVGAGSIAATSVAGEESKFGVPLAEQREAIIRRFVDHPWLIGVHAHVGSQGCPPALLVESAGHLVGLADEVNRALVASGAPRRLRHVDIGGGLPVSYRRGRPGPAMRDFSDRLRARCPALFDGSYRLITEFGRWLHANCGFLATRVEYVKREPTMAIAIVHVGADMFLRRCYQPANWHHDFAVCDGSGRLKDGRVPLPTTLAGPLCFAGDVLLDRGELPSLTEGDHVIVHDAGAYTLAMWSRYNSRQLPKVIGYRDGGATFELLKARESVDGALALWS